MPVKLVDTKLAEISIVTARRLRLPGAKVPSLVTEAGTLVPGVARPLESRTLRRSTLGSV